MEGPRKSGVTGIEWNISLLDLFWWCQFIGPKH